MPIVSRVGPTVTSEDLNLPFAAAWPGHSRRDFVPVLSRSLTFVCAYRAGLLIGFVDLAWDGGTHAFLLDVTVHPDLRRRGIGQDLVHRAVAVARERDVQWLHVDFDPHLQGFYERCGFRPTTVGLIHLHPDG